MVKAPGKMPRDARKVGKKKVFKGQLGPFGCMLGVLGNMSRA
jgi:hypothetical protein